MKCKERFASETASPRLQQVKEIKKTFMIKWILAIGKKKVWNYLRRRSFLKGILAVLKHRFCVIIALFIYN